MKEIVIGAYLSGAALWLILHAYSWFREGLKADWRDDWPLLLAGPFFHWSFWNHVAHVTRGSLSAYCKERVMDIASLRLIRLRGTFSS